jgi:hypothetical protein
MNDDQIANTLSIIIPYFFIVLWVLVPIVIIWGSYLFAKRRENSNKKIIEYFSPLSNNDHY